MIKESIITKVTQPTQNLKVGNKLPALFLKKPLCTGDLSSPCKIFIERPVIPNLSIDEEISLWDNRMILFGVIYHEGEQSLCGHYTAGANVDNTYYI